MAKLANDDDTLTLRELTEALHHYTLPQSLINQIVRFINARREPDYKAGDVYRDANGRYIMHTTEKRWFVFGSTIRLEYDWPPRPLEKVN